MLKYFTDVFAWGCTFALLMFVCAALAQSMALVVVGIGAITLVSLYGLVGIGIDSAKGRF